MTLALDKRLGFYIPIATVFDYSSAAGYPILPDRCGASINWDGDSDNKAHQRAPSELKEYPYICELLQPTLYFAVADISPDSEITESL